ncbi:AlbA family DNA-binding domain-containing protein [Tardiphaga sp. 11_C7_N12_6]|uniref:AlbA family DNA-binding domain-containing protein n=1 Tax=Tardiphaga sp. 11_C7_N12_6 TaxID=3240789 RepID=UPI003F22397C
MFSGRLSDLAKADVERVIAAEIAEGLDVEFKRSLPARSGEDPWMTGGKIGDDAKDQLAREIIAFANTDGGTLIIGIGEDRMTKRAIGPLRPIPHCKDAANSLLQALGQRIEPRLPPFECEAVITEDDDDGGVIIMRVLPSYLAPHRHTQDRHCYVRRGDASVPMSMVEIQEATKRIAGRRQQIDAALEESANRFFQWIPPEFQRTNPVRSVQSAYRNGSLPNSQQWVGSWALRITAKPFSPLPASSIVSGDKTSLLSFPSLKGEGQQGVLQLLGLSTIRTWQPRLRSTERAFDGANLMGLDRLSSEGQIDRFVFVTYPEDRPPTYMFISANELMWHFASVMHFVNEVRAKCFRPSQGFALEVELFHSIALYVEPYAGLVGRGRAVIPPHRVAFPRYEVAGVEEFDQVLTAFDQDVWNSGGFHADWDLSLNWPDV